MFSVVRCVRLLRPVRPLPAVRHASRVVVSDISPDPETAVDRLSLLPMERPVLSTLPADAVVVQVASVAVHWVDLLMMAGQYQHAPPLPYTPGERN